MAAAANTADAGTPHVPVLLDGVLKSLAPIAGRTIVDGTFGAGGYARAMLASGAARVIGIDQDPDVMAMATWVVDEPDIELHEGRFSELDDIVSRSGVDVVDAVVLDIGVSSMQIDRAERGFSFMRDGPLDMRMSGQGPSAADLVNRAEEGVLADVIFRFGEDRAARRIARAIVRARAAEPITRTLALAETVASALPRGKPGQAHPATRTFQALRIAVNDELGELVRGLSAAERILRPGGILAVVTFHSLEDRIVKRYLQRAALAVEAGSRHGPIRALPVPRYEKPRKAVEPSPGEIKDNPRARSARLRSAVRTDAPFAEIAAVHLGLPQMPSLGSLSRGLS